MGYPEISVNKTTTPTTYGGDAMTKHQRYKKGIDVAATDPTNKPDVNTATRYRSGKFILFMQNNIHEIVHNTPAMTQSVDVSYPTNMDDVETNEFVFKDLPTTIKNKSLPFADNSFPNFIAPKLQMINEGTEPVGTTSITPFYRKDIDVNNQAVYISKLENGVAVKVRVA